MLLSFTLTHGIFDFDATNHIVIYFTTRSFVGTSFHKLSKKLINVFCKISDKCQATFPLPITVIFIVFNIKFPSIYQKQSYKLEYFMKFVSSDTSGF